jgi:hypothetical protein
MPEPLIEVLRRWLDRAVRSSASSDSEFSVAAFDKELLSVIRVDLDGVHESATGIEQAIAELLASPPSSNALEDCLFELESQVAHAVYHWKSVTRALRAKQLWLPDDIEPGSP